MKDHWYCRVEGQQYGPYTWDQMRAMAAEGRLVAQSEVRREVDQRWFTAGKIPGLLGAPQAQGKSAATVMVKEAARDSTSGPDVTSTVVPSDAKDSNGQVTVKRKPAKAAQDSPPVPPPKAISPPPRPSNPKAPPKNPSPPIPTAIAIDSPLGIVVAPPVATGSRSGKPPGAEPDDGSLSPLLVAVGGGGVLVLLLFVGGIVTWRISQSTSPQAQVAAADQQKPVTEPKPAISDAELDAILGVPPPALLSKPAAAAKSAPVALEAKSTAAATNADKKASTDKEARDETAKLASTAAPSPPDPQLEAAKKIVERYKDDLRPVEGTVIANRGGTIQLEVAAVWLAKDEKGARVDPVLPAPDSAPAGATSAAPAAGNDAAGATSPGKFVFVEIRVTNGSDIPRKYTSWNLGDATKVILAADADQLLPLVPVAETPDVVRQSSRHIPPGHLIRDVLVFRAPARPFDSLQLLLAQSVIAPGQRGYFPLEVPVEFFFKEVPPLPPAAIAADGSAPAGEGEAIPVEPRDPNAPEPLDSFTEALKADKKRRDMQNDDSPPN